jgi:hypothetical protein
MNKASVVHAWPVGIMLMGRLERMCDDRKMRIGRLR